MSEVRTPFRGLRAARAAVVTGGLKAMAFAMAFLCSKKANAMAVVEGGLPSEKATAMAYLSSEFLAHAYYSH